MVGAGEHVRNLFRAAVGLGQEHLHRKSGLVGVDPRREHKSRRRSRHLALRIVSSRREQRAHGDTPVFVDPVKTAADDEAVFVEKGHCVRHGADGGKVAALIERRAHVPVAQRVRAHQFQRHAGAGQTVKRVSGVRAFGVDNRIAGGQLPFALVVVGYNYVDPAGLERGDLFHCRNAEIDRHDKPHAARQHICKALL